MPTTVIIGAARTPIGKMGGGLSTLDATALGATAIEAALERADVAPEQVGHVVMGQVLQAGQGQIPSRQAQIKAGIPKEVSSETINKVCASGLRSCVILDQAIRAGDVEIGVGGGMESMSQAPYLLPGARFGFRMGDVQALDAMVHDGLTNPFSGKQMFVEATAVGDELELTRPELDRWALRSHELALKAIDDGRMSEEIVSVTVNGRKSQTVVEIDEGPRRDTSLEKLAALPGLVGKEGSHTAGNSPGVNDGAGALVLCARGVGERQRQGAARRDRRPRPERQRLRLSGHDARQRRQARAREGRPAAGRHRPVGDQRGLRLGHAELDPDARHRRGPRQRQWRRRRARPSDRRLGRSHSRRADLRAAPARRRPRLRGDLLRRWSGRRGDPARLRWTRPRTAVSAGRRRSSTSTRR